MKLIINADDCGRSPLIDEHIGKALSQKRISSTTVMANMDDLDGAVKLYNKYHEHASFGLHINLTQGKPLLDSKILLDYGFYKQVGDHVEFNAQPFRRKFLSSTIRKEIYKEIMAQYNKVRNAGIVISHIDSHHFIHQAFFMLPLMPKFCKEIGIFKVRNYRNYMPFSIGRAARDLWSLSLKLQEPRLVFTSFFTSYEGFYNSYTKGKVYYTDKQIVELMCHPGGQYTSEEELLLNTDPEVFFKAQLIDYNNL